MSIQGFPKLGTQVKIINKLNQMALTLSSGQFNTKIDNAISQIPEFHLRQTFKITQKGHSQLYFIQPVNKMLVLSTKSGWGDMVYSQTKFQKYNQQTTQMWRIVPYSDVMVNQKNQPKHVFQYVPLLINPDAIKSSQQPSNNLKLGYQFVPYKQQYKTSQKQLTQPIYKLGYEFESGPHVKAYVKIEPQNKMKVGYQQLSQQKSKKPQVIYPKRFPIKQKNNILPIDRDTKGWFFIENVMHNLVLQIEGGINQRGMNIVLNKLYGNRNQLWRFQ